MGRWEKVIKNGFQDILQIKMNPSMYWHLCHLRHQKIGPACHSHFKWDFCFSVICRSDVASRLVFGRRLWIVKVEHLHPHWLVFAFCFTLLKTWLFLQWVEQIDLSWSIKRGLKRDSFSFCSLPSVSSFNYQNSDCIAKSRFLDC